jgi:hypothetical protein
MSDVTKRRLDRFLAAAAGAVGLAATACKARVSAYMAVIRI